MPSLEEAFPNDPHFVAKRILMEGEVDNTGELKSRTSVLLYQMGDEVAVALMAIPVHPPRIPPTPGWLAKKARDGILAALEETLFAQMNRTLGLPEDYRP